MITERLNQNRYRRYPFVDDANMAFSGGGLLADDVLLELSVLTTSTALVNLTLQSIVRSADTVPILTFNFNLGRVVVSADLDTDQPVSYLADGVALQATFGPGLTQLPDQLAVGTHSFDEPPRIREAAIMCQHQHRVDTVQSQTTVNGTPVLTGTAAGGRIWVVEGYNCRLAVTGVPSRLRIDVGYGLGAGVYCLPVGNGACADSLQRINGLNGGTDGDFTIVAGAGVKIVPDMANHQLLISSTRTQSNVGCQL